MPRRTAGYRYPHATTEARKHDCRLCHVADMIAERAADGTEEWGTPHRLGPFAVTEPEIEDITDALYIGRSCRKRKKYKGALSISIRYLTSADEWVSSPPARRPEGYVLIMRVWSRTAGHAEMHRRAEAGEAFRYNVLRG